ncbi:MAG: response regulator transcription factor [Phycicoccus sp.]
MASANASVPAGGAGRAIRDAARRAGRGARPLDLWSVSLFVLPAFAIADQETHSGIRLADPGAWASWWWAPVVWSAQVLPLVWRRRRPGSTLLAVAIGLAASQYLVPVHTLADLGVLLGFYSVGAWATRRVRWWSATIGVALACLALWAASRSIGATAPGVLIMVVAPLAIGELTRERRVSSTPGAASDDADGDRHAAARTAEPATPAAVGSDAGLPGDDEAAAPPYAVAAGTGVAHRGGPAPSLAAVPGSDALSPRERDVLALVADGLSNPEIARRLHVSRETVKSHVAALLAKLDCRDRVHLAILVHRSGAMPGPHRATGRMPPRG